MKAWVALDSDHSTTKLYANEIFPTTVVIDRDSKIVQITRPKNVTEEMLNEVLDGTQKGIAKDDGNAPKAPTQKPPVRG